MFPKDIHQGSLPRVMISFLLAMFLAGLFICNAIAQKGIVVDGKKDNWQGIQPILRDPKDMENEKEELDIKAVYATSNDKYLYIMAEMYGVPLLKFEYAFTFDVNEDGITEYSIDFGSHHQFLHNGDFESWKPGEFSIISFGKFKVFKMKYSIDEAIECKIPLSYLDNPGTIGIGSKTMTFDVGAHSLRQIEIDSACCGKIDTFFKTKQQSREKKAGIGAVAAVTGILAAIGYLKKKRKY